MAQQGRSVLALMLLQMASRRRSLLGYLVDVAMPVMHIAIIFGAYLILSRRDNADIGISVLLFLASGFIPYHVCTDVLAWVQRAQRATRRLGLAPAVQPIDHVIATALLEGLTMIVVGVLVFAALRIFFGIEGAAPHRPLMIVESLAALFLLALGFGLLSGSLARRFPPWRLFSFLLRRALFLTSGLFYTIDNLPPEMREALSWNPLLHGIEWFRLGIYPDYQPLTLSTHYLLGFGLTCLVLGLALERVDHCPEAQAARGR